ncbi:Proteasome subunit family protein [Aspergillus niger]|uniref:Proteasome subunit family protein n=1 Tax=Aspergillus niger TaxID=5061 RepID=A0A505I8P2_ASPNG|nr:Proteasome subunit family protein [Aspergillus niger]
MNHLDLPPLSTQDPHRVISFPASQSLHASTAFPDAASGRNAIPTGLVALDEAISAPVTLSSSTTNERIRESGEGEVERLKGLPVGHVTEVFGPPGAGKTMLGDVNQPQQAQRDVQKWLTTRKWNVISDLAAQLTKFASRANLAVLVINQTHTRIRGQVRATLSPILSGRGWESCVRARVGVYGDLGYGVDGGRVRVAEVMKRDGRLVTVRDVTSVVPFRVANDGLYAVEMGLENNEEEGVAVQVREKQAQDEEALEQEEPLEEEPVEEEEPELEDYQAQEEPAEGDPAQEEPAQEGPAQGKPDQEEPAQEEPAQKEPAQKDLAQGVLVREEPLHNGHTQEHIEKVQTQEIQADNEQAQDVCSDMAQDTASQRKRKAEEIADSQDEEDSEVEFE